MLKNLILIWIVIAGPIMLGTYAWAMRLLFDAGGMALFLIACLAHVTVWISIGFLFDSRQQPRQFPKRDR